MTTRRMPEIPLDELSVEQRRVHDRIVSGPRGHIGAPHWAWLRSPRLAEQAQQFGQFCRFETEVDSLLIEIAILTTAAHWRAALEWDLHVPVATCMGLPADIIEAIRVEGTPEFSDGAQKAVHDFVRALLTQRQVGDSAYRALVEQIGEKATVELVGLLGYYSLISMTIIAFEVPSHLRENDSFADRRAAE